MCEISIDSVDINLTEDSETFPEITVSGTAIKCKEVEVIIECTSHIEHRVEVSEDIFTTTFTLEEAGSAKCVCNHSDVTVHVACVDNKDCFDEKTVSVECCSNNIIIGYSEEVDCQKECVRNVHLVTTNASDEDITAFWDFGDGNSGESFVVPFLQTKTITHEYEIGVYTATLNVSECTYKQTFSVSECSTCEIVFGSEIAEECDEESGLRKVIFSVAGSKLCNNTVDGTLEFGDGTENEQFTLTEENPTEIIEHNYAPGTYTASLSNTGCSEETEEEEIEIPECDVIISEEDSDDSEGGWCLVLRLLTALLGAFAIISGVLAICVPSAATALAWIAFGLAVLAAIVGVFWGIVCDNKPCKYGLLLSGQIALGAGLVLLSLSACCNLGFWAGLASVLTGIGILYAWKEACDFSNCRLAREIAYIGSSIVIPLISNIVNIPVLSMCVDNVLFGIVGSVISAVTLYALACKTNAPSDDEVASV